MSIGAQLEPLSWTDRDGDLFEITLWSSYSGPAVLALISVSNDEHRGSVFVDEQDARQLIAWLQERLRAV